MVRPSCSARAVPKPCQTRWAEAFGQDHDEEDEEETRKVLPVSLFGVPDGFHGTRYPSERDGRHTGSGATPAQERETTGKAPSGQASPAAAEIPGAKHSRAASPPGTSSCHVATSGGNGRPQQVVEPMELKVRGLMASAVEAAAIPASDACFLKEAISDVGSAKTGRAQASAQVSIGING